MERTSPCLWKTSITAWVIWTIERTSVKSTNYACLKGNHLFTMTVEKLKAFLTALLVRGYAKLPRQEMYWENWEDCHNLVPSAMMEKTKFLECKHYLQVADNNALNNSDKFVRVRPLLNAINEQCILNYKPTQHVSVGESTVTYFGKHEAKQYIHGKTIKFGFELWIMATPSVYCIQFLPYSGKDSIIQKC